jgi:hypothetical protein
MINNILCLLYILYSFLENMWEMIVVVICIIIIYYIYTSQANNTISVKDGSVVSINCKAVIKKATYGPIQSDICENTDVTNSVQLLFTKTSSFVVSGPILGVEPCGVNQGVLVIEYTCTL